MSFEEPTIASPTGVICGWARCPGTATLAFEYRSQSYEGAVGCFRHFLKARNAASGLHGCWDGTRWVVIQRLIDYTGYWPNFQKVAAQPGTVVVSWPELEAVFRIQYGNGILWG